MVWIRTFNFKLFNIITRTDKSFISFKHSVLGKLLIMEHNKLKKCWHLHIWKLRYYWVCRQRISSITKQNFYLQNSVEINFALACKFNFLGVTYYFDYKVCTLVTYCLTWKLLDSLPTSVPSVCYFSFYMSNIVRQGLW